MKNFKRNITEWITCMASLCIVFAIGVSCADGDDVTLDNVRPLVSSTSPAHNATGVAFNTAVAATFSEKIDPKSITVSTLTLHQGLTPVAGSVNYADVTAIFTPDAVLLADTMYTATVTKGVADIAGNTMAVDKVWTFTTGSAPDITAPTVSITVPVLNALDVPLNTAVSATFSEAMNSALTINTTTFTLAQGVVPVVGTVIYGGVTAIFTPDAVLAASTVYTATITTGVTDLAGNALAVDKVWTFTTGTVLDSTAPTVSATVPANSAMDVSIDSALSATFTESMNPVTVTTVTFTLMNGATPVAGSVNYGGLTALFTPDEDLVPSTLYTATITTGVEDLAGNALAVNKVWTFTTGTALDLTVPTVDSTLPARAAINTPVGSTVAATFSEAMNPLTITLVSFTLTKDGVASVAGVVNYAGTTATYTPDVDFDLNTVYNARISTSIADLAGNAITSDYVWSFTTTANPVVANPDAPVLGEAGRFVILASQKVTTTGVTAISGGDIGIEDQARSYYEGFTNGVNPGEFIELVGGLSYAGDDIPPFTFPAPYASTIAFINQVRTDLGVAYTFLAADPNPGAPTQVCPIELGGLTLTRGVYKTALNVIIQQGDLHLDAQGDANSVWVFTIDGNFTTGAPGGNIVLENGALAENVYWRVAGTSVIGAGTAFKGNLLSWEQVNALAGAVITGSLFSVNEQVTLIANTVTKP